MKFTVNTNEFKVAIEKVIKATTKNPALKVLENIHITANNNVCRLHATDLITTIVSNIPTVSSESIDFILDDVKNLCKAIKFFKEYEIAFNIDENKLTMSCGDKKISQNIKIETEKDNIFPCINEAISNKKYTYNVSDLKKRVNLINYAVAKSDNRPIFQGIHFNENDMVAIDGFKLAVNSNDSLNIDTPITVPETALKIAVDVLCGDIKITTDSKYISIKDDNTSVIIRLLDGVFHDYKKTIPTNTNFVDVDVKNFTEALKYLKTFIDEKTKAPIQWLGNELRLKTAKGMYEVSINTVNTTDDVIGFNCSYMLDGLSQFKDNASISLGKKNSPMLIKNDNNIALVLPVHIKEDISCFKTEESA